MTSRALATALHPRNRWLVLGFSATAVLSVLVVLSFTGAIGGGSTPREAVAAYIGEVNATQRGVAIERQRVDMVYAQARTDPKGLAGRLADLDRSARALREFDRRLRALGPPVEAAELHRRLVALSAAEAVFAAETARLGRYLPALERERREVAGAGVRLRRDLVAKTDAPSQATVLDRFADEIASAAKPLQGAPVPAALEPAKEEEIARAADLSASAGALAKAIREGRGSDVRAQAQRFGRAARGSGNAVERKAVIAFDAQARRIDTLRLGVARERTRLDRDVR